jgi:hypothetical protein
MTGYRERAALFDDYHFTSPAAGLDEQVIFPLPLPTARV